MLFHRQRLLLTLLDTLGESITQTDFQKLLFLYTREYEEIPSYEFVPYRFGCFSYTSYADKRRLIETGLLKNDDEHWSLTNAGQQAARVKAVDPLQIAGFCERYEGLRGNELIADVYRRYPYYATRSEILEKIFPNTKDRELIDLARPKSNGPALLTIGYEGKCLEGYLNQLLQAGVTLLCDVRRNPLSRKYGFSKGTLGKACTGVGIRYEHLPELGIASDQRQNLDTQADYDSLFETYEKKSLPKQSAALEQICRWIVDDKRRVALTCFELLPHQCHRHCVAEALEHKKDKHLVPIHL